MRPEGFYLFQMKDEVQLFHSFSIAQFIECSIKTSFDVLH